MLAAVCWRAAACDSVRRDRSAFPVAISWVAVAMVALPSRTDDTVSNRPSRIAESARISLPISSCPPAAIGCVRSPFEIAEQACNAFASGTEIAFCKPRAHSAAITMPSSISAADTKLMFLSVC